MTVQLATRHILEFEIGQIVYLKTDKEQLPRIITNIMLRPNCGVSYCLVNSVLESWHYPLEVDCERNELLALDVNNFTIKD